MRKGQICRGKSVPLNFKAVICTTLCAGKFMDPANTAVAS